ncbi:WD repeat-containing protein 6 [Coemansia spiralis]|nr:WD repeat-containing protein 6 [Coemansia spiralis]
MPQSPVDGRGSSGLSCISSRLPVTAVEFLGDTIVLTGSGGVLRAYSVATRALVWQVDVFPSARIHGIVVGGPHVLVFGSKSWAVVAVDGDGGTGGRRLFTATERDWIKAGRWVDGHIALVLAHNQLCVYDIHSLRPMCTAQCEEQCILYAAALWGSTLDTLVVASGTVFNQVLVWRADGRVRHRLCGHEGVVFGVAFGDDGETLASVSDDRTMRVWTLPHEGCDSEAPLTLYGHSARVWRCVVLDSLLVSASEDGTVRVWDRRGCLIDTWRQCKKNVWSLAATCGLVASGASDESVRVWPLRDVHRRCVEDTAALDPIRVPPQHEYLPPAQSPRATEHIRGFALTDWNSAVVVMDSGCVLAHRGAEAWSRALHVRGLAGYSMVAGCGDGLVAVGARDGTVLLVREDTGRAPEVVVSAQLHSQAVQQLMLVRAGRDTYNLVTVDARGGVLWTRIVQATASTDKLEWSAAATLSVPGAARVASASVSAQHGWAAIGSANGGLYLYDLPQCLPGCPTAEYDPATGSAFVPLLAPAAQWLQAHGKHTLAALEFEPLSAQVLDDATPGPRSCVLLTGGRDGQMHRFEVGLDAVASASAAAVRNGITANSGHAGRAVTLRRVATSRLTGGWVAQLVRYRGNLYAVSFYNKRLVVTDVARANAVLLSVACSGGAKPWQVLFAEHGLRVAFMHHGQLWAYQLNHDGDDAGFSLADGAVSCVDIRAVACVSIATGVSVVATGGEDGCLRIHCGLPSLSVVASSRRHRSAIKCASFVPPTAAASSTSLYLLTGGAGCELRCWEVDVCPDGHGPANVVECAVAAAAGAAPVDGGPDLRIMDMVTFVPAGASAFAAAAYSDSSIVLWRLDVPGHRLQRVARTSAHGCLFSTALIHHGDAAFVLAGTSSGSIVSWDVSFYLGDQLPQYTREPAGQIEVLLASPHQSGVNALCVRELGESHFLVASGGDDGRVAVGEVVVTQSAITVVRTASATVHASAVQGVAFAGASLVSVSTDQRLALWDVCTTPGALSLSLHRMELTHVADPSALHVSAVRGGHIALVAGIGMEAFELYPTK